MMTDSASQSRKATICCYRADFDSEGATRLKWVRFWQCVSSSELYLVMLINAQHRSQNWAWPTLADSGMHRTDHCSQYTIYIYIYVSFHVSLLVCCCVMSSLSKISCCCASRRITMVTKQLLTGILLLSPATVWRSTIGCHQQYRRAQPQGVAPALYPGNVDQRG